MKRQRNDTPGNRVLPGAPRQGCQSRAIGFTQCTTTGSARGYGLFYNSGRPRLRRNSFTVVPGFPRFALRASSSANGSRPVLLVLALSLFSFRFNRVGIAMVENDSAPRVNGRNGLKAPDVDFRVPLPRLGNVIGRLHPHQCVHLDAESLFDAQRHFAGQGRLEVEQARESWAGYPERGGGSRHREASRLNDFRPDKITGVGWIFNRHILYHVVSGNPRDSRRKFRPRSCRCGTSGAGWP